MEEGHRSGCLDMLEEPVLVEHRRAVLRGEIELHRPRVAAHEAVVGLAVDGGLDLKPQFGHGWRVVRG